MGEHEKPTDRAESLAEALPREQARVRAIQAEYRALPGNAGAIGAAMMEADLKAAEKASAAGDVVAMLRAYEALSGYEL